MLQGDGLGPGSLSAVKFLLPLLAFEAVARGTHEHWEEVVRGH